MARFTLYYSGVIEYSFEVDLPVDDADEVTEDLIDAALGFDCHYPSAAVHLAIAASAVLGRSVNTPSGIKVLADQMGEGPFDLVDVAAVDDYETVGAGR